MAQGARHPPTRGTSLSATTGASKTRSAAKTATKAALIIKDIDGDVQDHILAHVPGATVLSVKPVQVTGGVQYTAQIDFPGDPTNLLNEWMTSGNLNPPFEDGALLFWTSNPSGGFVSSKNAARGYGPDDEHPTDCKYCQSGEAYKHNYEGSTSFAHDWPKTRTATYHTAFGDCPVCGGPGWGAGEICMPCVKSRAKAAQNHGRCSCGNKKIPGPEKAPFGPRGRKWIPCERCLGTIKQTGKKTAGPSGTSRDIWATPTKPICTAHPAQPSASAPAPGDRPRGQ